MAAPYGTAVVNVAALKTHEVDGDWGHAWAQTSTDGIGTGPFRLASFDQLEGVELARFEDYCIVTESVRHGIEVDVTVKDARGRTLLGDKSFEAGS